MLCTHIIITLVLSIVTFTNICNAKEDWEWKNPRSPAAHQNELVERKTDALPELPESNSEDIAGDLRNVVKRLKYQMSKLHDTICQIIIRQDSFSPEDELQFLNCIHSITQWNSTFFINGKSAPEDGEINMDTSAITQFEIRNGIIDLQTWSKLFRSFVNLEVLVLTNVEMKALPFPFRVTFPKLSRFVLNHNPHIYKYVCKLDSITDYDFNYLLKYADIDKSSLKSLLFFNSPAFSDWEIENIVNLNIDIEFSVGITKFLQINHSRQEIISRLSFTNEILKNLYAFDVKMIDLFNVTLNVSLIPSTVTHLKLDKVTLIDKNLSDILKNCKKLIDLNIKNVIPAVEISLIEFPATLKNLTLQRQNLSYIFGSQFGLDNLVLYDCNLDDRIVNEFSRIFSAKNVTLSYSSEDSKSVVYPILEEFMSDFATTKAILVYNMTRTPAHPELDYKFVAAALKDFGIEESCRNFMLELVDSRIQARCVPKLQMTTDILEMIQVPSGTTHSVDKTAKLRSAESVSRPGENSDVM